MRKGDQMFPFNDGRAVLALTAIVFMSGCQSVPTVTRTGDVKDIIIGDNLTAGNVTVNPGDEVRWINKRTAPVRVVVIDSLSDKQVSCKNNFGGWRTSGDTAELATNESASLCFRDAGMFRYTVRMKSSTTTGELNVPGVVQVGRIPGQSVEPTGDQTAENRGERSSDPNNKVNGQNVESTTTTTTTTTTLPPR